MLCDKNAFLRLVAGPYFVVTDSETKVTGKAAGDVTSVTSRNVFHLRFMVSALAQSRYKEALPDNRMPGLTVTAKGRSLTQIRMHNGA